jgi:hypothetical protein
MPLKGLVSERSTLLGGVALLSCLFVYYYLIVYRDYLPGADDVAFIGALASPADWFTQGYSNYFDVYPEWGPARNTDLLKPVTNSVGYFNQTLFGEHYALHFALFFLIQFGGLVVFLRLLRESSVPALPAAFMGLLFLVNPAFVNAGLWCLACHFDVLAGQLALVAFLMLWRGNNAWALLFLTLAIFTKETAAFAPVAAALSILMWGRERRSAVLMLLPLLLWAGLRGLAYGGVLGGRLDAPVGSFALGLLFWPTGVTDAGLIEQLDSTIALDRHNIISLGFLIANVVLWAFILYATVITARRQFVRSPHPGKDVKLIATLLIWTLGALSIGVLVAHEARYGGSYYTFLYLFLAVFLFSSETRVPRWVAASVLLVFAAGTVWHAQENLRVISRWQYTEAPTRALHDALRELPQDGRVVYVINAPRGFVPAMKYLNRAWSLNLEVVVINHVQRCEGPANGGMTRFAGSGGDVLEVRIPDCALFDFFRVSPALLQRGITGPLERQGVGTYHFPDGVIRSNGNQADLADLGHSLTFRIESGRSPTVIAYEWKALQYKVVSPS